jgi:hypothetical protein
VSELDRGVGAASVEGWRVDPFGRHESRFHDGARWTPYVKDGETHSLDEPVAAIARDTPGPEILTAPVLVVEEHVAPHDPASPASVLGRDGSRLGAVRRSPDEEGRWEVLGSDGSVALALTKAPSTRRTVLAVRDAGGAEMGRLLEQHAPGMRIYALESSAGGKVGFVRARTWAGWDIRVEDEHNRPVAEVSKRWAGLDRSLFPAEDAYVARIDREMHDPQRALVYAAALTVGTLLKKDTRGFQ